MRKYCYESQHITELYCTMLYFNDKAVLLNTSVAHFIPKYIKKVICTHSTEMVIPKDTNNAQNRIRLEECLLCQMKMSSSLMQEIYPKY